LTGRRLVLLLSIGYPALTGSARGQEDIPVVVALPATAWATGFGNAGIALPGFAGSVYSNPAGLTSIRSVGFEAAWSRLSSDATYTLASIGARKQRWFVGLAGQRVTGPNESKPVGSSYAGSLGFSKGMTAAGVTLRRVANTVPGQPQRSAVAADVGTILAVFDIAALGVVVENAIVDQHQDPGLKMPRVWRAGFSMNFLDTYSNGRLMGTIETAWAEGRRRATTIGVEGAMVVKGVGVLGRVGRTGAVGSVPPQTSYGASVLIGRARIDYGYLETGPFGGRLREIGIRWTP
jgi:hypothetical protein